MPTTYWVVDVEVGPAQAQECADKVKQWLIQEGIVLPTPPEPTEIFPMDSPCYPKHLLAPGPKADDWCSFEDHFTIFCGLEIVTGKRVFDPGGNFTDAIECPNCGSIFNRKTLDWMAAIDRWWSKNDGSLICNACYSTRDIGTWKFPGSGWAFGYLGFGFNDWSVDERMLKAIGNIVQHRCVLICNHI